MCDVIIRVWAAALAYREMKLAVAPVLLTSTVTVRSWLCWAWCTAQPQRISMWQWMSSAGAAGEWKWCSAVFGAG